MSILSWNCRGLGNPTAVSSLRDLVRTYQPDVIFLCETLVQASKMEAIRARLGYDSSFAVSSIGRSGGLAILWNHPFGCEILNYSQHFINIKVSNGERPIWQLTCFYGCPESERRRESWNILRTLAADNSLPWCVIGDFNDLLSNDEKRGRSEHPLWKIRGFRGAVSDCHLTDLVLEGHQFTWSKGRGTDDFKERKLDRAMASHDWFLNFPHYRLCNTVTDKSDHSPILLLLFGEGRRRRRRSFKFENSWLEEESLEEVVVRGWGVGIDLDLVNRLRACTEEMNVWGRSLRLRF